MIASWIGFGFSFWTTTSAAAWRPPLAIQAFWSLSGLVCLWWIPESPRWLVMKDREEEAQDILYRLHSDATDPDHEFASAEMYQIKKQLHIDRTLDNGWVHLFKKPSYRKRVLMACVSCSPKAHKSQIGSQPIPTNVYIGSDVLIPTSGINILYSIMW
jgi:hypothetical protein